MNAKAPLLALVAAGTALAALAAKRRKTASPVGETYPSAVVDRRAPKVEGALDAPSRAETPGEVVTEYYEEHPTS